MVQFAQPALESGRLNFSIDTLGNSEEITVSAGVYMTDLFIDGNGSGDLTCYMTTWD